MTGFQVSSNFSEHAPYVGITVVYYYTA